MLNQCKKVMISREKRWTMLRNLFFGSEVIFVAYLYSTQLVAMATIAMVTVIMEMVTVDADHCYFNVAMKVLNSKLSMILVLL